MSEINDKKKVQEAYAEKVRLARGSAPPMQQLPLDLEGREPSAIPLPPSRDGADDSDDKWTDPPTANVKVGKKR